MKKVGVVLRPSRSILRDVSVGLNKLGGFLAGRGKQGDVEKAVAHYQSCLELRELLLRDNPRQQPQQPSP